LAKPTFFIIGAPKCGTTSLARWLSRHPQILIPEIKEPHFFNTDDRRSINSLDGYEKLFSESGGRRRCVGEASVWYLSSATAVPNILRYQPQARFIVMVRDPVEMAPALHGEMVISGHENVCDFATAWSLQEERRLGRRLPPLSWAKRRFLYGDICKLGLQIERLFSLVPRDRVMVICLDELADGPRAAYLRVLRFLGVEDDGRTDFPAYNKARKTRWPLATRLLFLALQIKNRLGLDLRLNLWNSFSAANLMESSRDGLSPEMTVALRKYFAADVALLGRLIDRDLSHWSNNLPRRFQPERVDANESVDC
jgi:hypothetical protein